MECSIRKKRVFLLGVMLSLVFGGYAQGNEIKGRIMEKSESVNNPVSYANVALLKVDSTFVVGVSSDENGNFNLKGIENGDYILSASYLGYETMYVGLNNLSTSINLKDIRLISSAISLDEVTVFASHYVNQIDRKIIFPDENQVKKSTDGVDLLRNLQLSGIEINRIDNTIKGVRGGTADVRINGKQAQQNEILALNPRDIIRIEYHDNPSLRYGDNEVVVDYILRRRETGGNVMIYGLKGIPADHTNLSTVVKMNYRKSEFSFLAGIMHSDYNKSYRTNKEVFNWGDGSRFIRTEEGLPERTKNSPQSYHLGYGLIEPDKYHFFVRVGTHLYNRINNSKSSLTGENVIMTDLNSFKGTQPYANLYYQIKLKNEQLLVFDVLGYYHNSESNRNYTEIKEKQILTDITTGIDSKRYWIVGEGFYEKGFEAGRLNVGVKHTQTYQKNYYTGDFASNINMDQSITYFYLEWMGRINKFSYSGGIGGTQIYTKQGNEKSNNLHFTPTLRLGYQFNNNYQIRYVGRIGVQSPLIGDMNAVEQAIDTLQIRRGNPFLRSAAYYHNLLTISYDKKPFSANLQMLDHYIKRPVMESIFEEDEKFIRMMENQKGWHQISTIGYVKVSLLGGNLNMNMRGGLNWFKSNGNKYSHTLYNWFMISGIDYTWKKWNPFLEISTRRNTLSGETISYSAQATYFGLRYKLDKFSMSAYYKHSFGWDSGRDNLNQYASNNIRNYSPDTKNVFFIDFIWNFQFGRKYSSGQKKINNSDNDSGIMNISK